MNSTLKRKMLAYSLTFDEDSNGIKKTGVKNFEVTPCVKNARFSRGAPLETVRHLACNRLCMNNDKNHLVFSICKTMHFIVYPNFYRYGYLINRQITLLWNSYLFFENNMLSVNLTRDFRDSSRNLALISMDTVFTLSTVTNKYKS
jgi:hypothetical protein